MAALAVGLRAVHDLHGEGHALGGEPGEDARLEHRAQVVGVRQERVAVAALEQRLEHPGGQQRGVDVAVPGRAPLLVRVGRPLDRCEVVGEDLRLLVLEEVQRDVGLELVVARERRQRVLAGVEAVHQHERQPRAVTASQVEHLAHDDVEEGVAVLGLDQRLRPCHAHARPEAAVELDDHRLVQRRVGVGQLGGIDEVVHRLEIGVGQHARRPGLELAILVGEGRDRGVRHALATHLLLGRLQSLGGHQRRIVTARGELSARPRSPASRAGSRPRAASRPARARPR